LTDKVSKFPNNRDPVHTLQRHHCPPKTNPSSRHPEVVGLTQPSCIRTFVDVCPGFRQQMKEDIAEETTDCKTQQQL